LQIKNKDFTPALFKELLTNMIATKKWMTEGIYQNRAKDYTNPFRSMVYENKAEMENVIGKLEDNSFIKEQIVAFEKLEKKTNLLIRKWKLR